MQVRSAKDIAYSPVKRRDQYEFEPPNVRATSDALRRLIASFMRAYSAGFTYGSGALTVLALMG